VAPKRREDRKRLRLHPVVLAFAGATCLTAALIAVSIVGGRGSEAAPTATAADGSVTRKALFTGIPQDGIALGRPTAPLTLVEYADLQCPYCASWSRDVLPDVVERYVRSGRLRLEFRGLAFLGPDSDKALRAALAAGERDRLWDTVHALYERQGHENAGWVTDDLLRDLAPLGVDLERTGSPWVERQLVEAANAARIAGVPGTPYFQVRHRGGQVQPLPVDSLESAAFTAQLDRLLAR
jgi:protein-disulfide isomerase